METVKIVDKRERLEAKGEVVGLTILGVRQRVAASLAAQAGDGRRSRRRRA